MATTPPPATPPPRRHHRESRRRRAAGHGRRRSGFNPFAVSSAGAEGIAQFMPATTASLGLDNPFDAAQAIDAQAR